MTAPVNIAPDIEARVLGGIPINNIWLLMFYASDLVQIQSRGSFSFEKPPTSMFDFVSKLLVAAVERRIHRNLTLGFETCKTDLTRVRGKIDSLRTESRGLLARGRVACTYEVLSVDTTLNRYVLSAILKASRACSKDTATSCRKLSQSLDKMGVKASPQMTSTPHIGLFGYINPDDKLMLAAARLLHDMLLPTEEAGPLAMQHSGSEIHWLRKLFEKAIGGFYRAHLDPSAWDISLSSPLKWQINKCSPGIAEIFPQMRTDIVLKDLANGRQVVIDTKFTSILKAGYRRERSLSSAYIYQMYAYLFSQSAAPLAEKVRLEGMLVHPSVGVDLDECAEIQGRPIRFSTVDLAGNAQDIVARLLYLTKTFPSSAHSSPFSNWAQKYPEAGL